MSKPKKWHEVYPSGTEQGNKEAKFFKEIARSDFDFVSTSQLINATGLERDDIEEIIEKYAVKYDPPLIYAHEDNEETWCYWERCPYMVKKKKKSISARDMDRRVDSHIFKK